MYDPKNICRSCLAVDVKLFPLNAIVESGTRLDECFRAHMNVKISEDDGLPYNICVECLDKMAKFRKFYWRYLKSEAYLLELCMKSSFQRLEPDEAEAPVNDESKVDVEELVCDETVCDEELLDDSTIVSTKVEEVPVEESLADTFDWNQVEFTESDKQDATSVNSTNNSSDANSCRSRKKQSMLIYCLQCHEIYPTSNKLREHFNAAHGEDNAKGFCNHCSETFPSKVELMSHLHTHRHPATLVKCMYCDKTFQDRSKMTPHLRTHTGEKPYGCTICGRAFRQRSAMLTHMRLHTGKTISCPKCDKKFCRKGFLDIHMRVHDDIRPYACTLCDKKYRIKSHLSAHMLTHSDVRSFSCHVCGKLFKGKCALNGHLNIHIKPYNCPMCPLKAAKLYHFRMHLIKMHGIHDDPKLFMTKSEIV